MCGHLAGIESARLTPDERVIVFPGETREKDQILERGLEVIRGSAARKAA